MSLILIPKGLDFLGYDEETRDLLLCRGDPSGDYQVLGPLRIGNIPYRELPDYGGLTTAETVDDAHLTVVVPRHDSSFCHISCQTQDAIVSFNGGEADHFYITAGEDHLLQGLDLRAGVPIQAKNATAGSDCAIQITVW